MCGTQRTHSARAHTHFFIFFKKKKKARRVWFVCGEVEEGQRKATFVLELAFPFLRWFLTGRGI